MENRVRWASRNKRRHRRASGQNVDDVGPTGTNDGVNWQSGASVDIVEPALTNVDDVGPTGGNGGAN